MPPLPDVRTELPVLRVSRALRIVAGLMLVLILAVTFQHVIQQRATAIADAAADLMRLDHVIAEHTSRAVEAIDLLMQDLAAQPQREAMLQGERLQRQIDGTPQLLGIALLDADFAPRAQAGRVPHGAVEDLRANRPATAERAVGTPFRAATGTWSVPLVRRIEGALLVGFLDLGYFHDFYQAVDPAENGAIILHRRDGLVLARYPRQDTAVGSSYAALPPFSDVLARDPRAPAAGTAIVAAPGEGGERILAVRTLRPFPLAVSVSAGLENVLTSWQTQAGTILLTGLAAAGVIGALLLMLASESRRVEALLADSARARATAEHANARLTEQMEERERTEAALRQAQRLEAVGQLTGGVAHDFNNLLTVLLGNIDLIQATVDGDAGLSARLERMRSAAERGAQLTDQLLAFARRQPLMPRPASLNVVIGGMTDLVQSAMGGNIRVVLRLQDAPWLALVDTTQFELVILNLAINARDAMAKGGTLTIETANITLTDIEPTGDLPTGDYVVVRVSDTGLGMSQEVAAKAFEPFFTTKAPGQGSGLGLSQVYGLARQSGGGVRIDSAPGRGTSVSVFLPRAASETGTSDPGTRLAAPKVTEGARILLVDDDEAVRVTTAMILESLGYIIETAVGGVPALSRLGETQEFDLLLTDVAMPGMNGPELADRVRARFPNLPIVFFSGYADPDAIAGRQILQRMVRKPFRAIDLAAQIEAALAERASAFP